MMNEMVINAQNPEYIYQSLKESCLENVSDEITMESLSSSHQTVFKCSGAVLFYFTASKKGSFIKILADVSIKEINPYATQYKDGSWKVMIDSFFDFDAFLRIIGELCEAKYSGSFDISFGCCNDFITCSDALKCLHLDDPFYKGCGYRKNLEAGRIFYGKNKTI